MQRSVMAALGCVLAGLALPALAQDQAPVEGYATRPPTTGTGLAPGLKATELSPKTRLFKLVFAKGDDVESGLSEFAVKNHLRDAHFTAIGAFGSAMIGRSDRAKKAFRVVKLNEEMEVAAFSGSITPGRDGHPMVHAHCAVALLRNGAVYAGDCLQATVSLTMQMYLTDTEPLSASETSER